MMRRSRSARWGLSLVSLATLAAVACGGGELEAPRAQALAPVPTTSSSAPVVGPDGCVVGATNAAIITKLGFTREGPKGHAPGFNLDGRETPGADPLSCGKPDMIDPDGNLVDNQLAALIPAVEGIVGNAVDTLVQGAIDDGNLLILVKLDGAAALDEAPCVGMTVELAKVMRPSLGTDLVIEGYQTFELNPDADMSHGKGMISGGVLTTAPFELAIPLAIFDVSFTVHVHQARFRVSIDPDTGKMVGMLGGGVEIQEIIDGVAPGAGVNKILPMISLILKTSADLAPNADGDCTQISAALTFEAVPAFIR